MLRHPLHLVAARPGDIRLYLENIIYDAKAKLWIAADGYSLATIPDTEIMGNCNLFIPAIAFAIAHELGGDHLPVIRSQTKATLLEMAFETSTTKKIKYKKIIKPTKGNAKICEMARRDWLAMLDKLSFDYKVRPISFFTPASELDTDHSIQVHYAENGDYFFRATNKPNENHIVGQNKQDQVYRTITRFSVYRFRLLLNAITMSDNESVSLHVSLNVPVIDDAPIHLETQDGGIGILMPMRI